MALSNVDLRFSCGVKTLWYCKKDRHIDRMTQKESQEIDLHKYGQQTSSKVQRQVKWGWNNWITICKK